MERAAASGNKGKQKMTQDDDGADDHEDNMQGSGNDSNDRVLEDLNGVEMSVKRP
ncbi:hypothetical protein EDC04DRAFT_2903010 [Pisolithus marmoratus]|nr:hypothetical protein EDC04DRAFT_2903010 [Pisolithus marmoratus]